MFWRLANLLDKKIAMNSLTKEMQLQLSNLLRNQVLLVPTETAPYSRDWTTYYETKASAVVFPQTTEEVAALVKWARANTVGLVPSGGRTGLSGGACALHGEVVVSFEKMSSILGFEPLDQILQVQAGVITETVQKKAKELGLFYPVDFAARGSSHIGGNVATNAGGIKVLRYGLTRNAVMDLTVVTGRGDVLKLNRNLIKNATGLDLRHLFVGSEGILGFVTEVGLKLTRAPKHTQTLLVATETLDQVMDVFALFQRQVTLEAFEMFSSQALEYVLKQRSLSHPMPQVLGKAQFWVVMEWEQPHSSDESGLEAFSEAQEKGLVLDGVLAASSEQSRTLWNYREDISESLSHRSPYKNDISVRPSQVKKCIELLDRQLKSYGPEWEVIWFGHIGDGNLHINILRPLGMNRDEFVKTCRRVDELVFQAVQDCEGSISAEHGLGLSKKDFLHYTKDLIEQSYAKSIKSVFDPDGIINPGKVYP